MLGDRCVRGGEVNGSAPSYILLWPDKDKGRGRALQSKPSAGRRTLTIARTRIRNWRTKIDRSAGEAASGRETASRWATPQKFAVRTFIAKGRVAFVGEAIGLAKGADSIALETKDSSESCIG